MKIGVLSADDPDDPGIFVERYLPSPANPPKYEPLKSVEYYRYRRLSR